MGHIVLELTILAYQPKSRERSPHPRKLLTFALSDQNSVYPPHTRELDEDDDDKPLVRPDRSIVFFIHFHSCSDGVNNKRHRVQR